ncbi:MAG: tRNA (adenosine(37)-N6)-threonylcarbamoyltransferase complex dimerization subunit type 1 TsaB [Streptococcaceae bacterium]|jgi:tRNA threonylcarbamoyl adenosine modification protein YeaZ|nr:tRNA (adenosine(37)-N6)-threonylcarbamoyltransferase complex dimerization subunit type 1 TsaB [Streptococcaceae bacterium]
MKILAMDTSSNALSVAIVEDKNLLAEETLNIKKNHSIELMPTIDYLMKQINLKPNDLDRIVVAMGPGSYTGLRIAVTTAKTLAYTLGIELVGVSSLQVLAANAKNFDGLIIPLIDARRRNVYAGVYQWQKQRLISILSDRHIAFDKLVSYIAGKRCYFTGEVSNFSDEIKKIADVIIEPNLKLRLPSAYELAIIGRNPPPVEVHQFVPDYLKRVEAEENWLMTHEEIDDWVEKI